MKKLSFMILFLSVFSCADPCEDVSCGDNGTCNEGTCECDEGAFGDNCEDLYRDDFLGDWLIVDSACDVGNSNFFTYTFAEGNQINEIEITSSVTPDLLLTGKILMDSIALEPQVIIFGIPVTYTGHGKFTSSNSIDLTIVKEAPNQPTVTCMYQLQSN